MSDLNNALYKLRYICKRLNSEAEDATKTLREVESELKSVGIGKESAFLEEPLFHVKDYETDEDMGGGLPAHRCYCKRYVGFGFADNKLVTCVQERLRRVFPDGSEKQETIRFSYESIFEKDRRTRLEASKRLPELVDNVRLVAEKLAEKLGL